MDHPQVMATPDHLKVMMRIRRFEALTAECYAAEKIRGFLHLYDGEEAVATGVISQLQPQDRILGTYRAHGHALVRGLEARVILAELFGKLEGCCHGRGGSMHLFDAAKHFFGGNAIVASHLPQATGMALADRRKKRNAVTVCFFGEGAAAEGIFHETMNLSMLLRVPVLFVLENNRYAMGTALSFSHAQEDFTKKAAAYGMNSAVADGMDLEAVLNAAAIAIRLVREDNLPYLLICNTYRFRNHSMYDAGLYRTRDEVEEWKKRDPIALLETTLRQRGQMDDKLLATLRSAIEDEMKQALDFAEKGTAEPVEQLTHHLYGSGH